MSPDQQYGVIEQRFRNIEGQVTDLKSSLSSQIASIAAKMDERSKPQWQLMVSAIGVMMTILVALGSLVYLPIRADQMKNDTEILKLRDAVVPRSEHDSRQLANNAQIEKIIASIGRVADSAVTRTDLDERLKAYGARRDDYQNTANERMARQQKELDEIQKSIVSRGEHDKIWRGFEQRDSELQRQIEDMKRTYGDTFSLRDAIMMLQKRLDSIEGVDKAPAPAHKK